MTTALTTEPEPTTATTATTADPETTLEPTPEPIPEQIDLYKAEFLALQAAYKKIGEKEILKEVKRMNPKSQINKNDIATLQGAFFRDIRFAKRTCEISDSELRKSMSRVSHRPRISYLDAGNILKILQKACPQLIYYGGFKLVRIE